MSELFAGAKKYLGGKLANIDKPEAEIKDMDLKGVHLNFVDYEAKVAVSNPYRISIPICEITYTLKSAGRVIASGTIPDPGNLVGDSETILNVAIKVPNSVLVSLIKDVCRDWDIDYQLDLGLIIDLPVVGNFTIPLSQCGEVKLPTLSDLF